MSATATRRSTGVYVENEVGRRVVEVTCFDERRECVQVVYTDGEYQWAEQEHVNTLTAWDGDKRAPVEPVLRAMAVTVIDECGKYHRFPVRK